MLKSFVAILFLIGDCAQASAQVSAGRKFVGGSLGYHMRANPDGLYNSYSTGFSVRPSMGFLIKDRMALGADVGLSYEFYEYNLPTSGRVTEDEKRYSIGSFATWFVPLHEERFWFTIEGRLGYSRSSTEYSDNQSTNTLDGDNYSLSAGITPGLLFFPGPRWGITLDIGGLYFSHAHGIGNEETQNNILFTFGRFTLGVNYFFP
jgi:hypothetical protein